VARTGSELHRPWFARVLAWSAEAESRKGGLVHRRRLLDGLTGRVVEIGVGTGNNFPLYPSTVDHLVAVEPERNLQRLAVAAAGKVAVPIQVVAAVADNLPLATGSVDAAVVAGVLCSVPDPKAALAELMRVIRSGGELRFYEHVVADHAIPASAQRLLGATVWPRLMGGCHPAKDTAATLREAGFVLDGYDRFTFWGTPLSVPVAPRILGRARRPI
jgi:ubiquinone/menaquinone biosynthesis C-methylase UbiE